MDYRCRLFSLGNASTATRHSDSGGIVGPSYSLFIALAVTFVPALLLSILTDFFLPFSSVSLSYFIIAVQMRECLGKHSCIRSTFPIAILNGTCFFARRNISCFGQRFAYQKLIKLKLTNCSRTTRDGDLVSVPEDASLALAELGPETS